MTGTIMAPKKGSKGVRKVTKMRPARVMDSSDEDEHDSSDEDAHGAELTNTTLPLFGVKFMLFRVLKIAGSVVSFALTCGSVMQILTTAAAAGAVWARSGSDGKDGTQVHHHADSRVHRCGREVGFQRANQADIDADPRSRQVYAQLRCQVNKMRSHMQRVANFALFERYALEYHSFLTCMLYS